MQHRIYLSLWEKCQGKTQIANDFRYSGNAYYSCEIFTFRLYDFVALAGSLHRYAVCGVRWFGLNTFRFNDWTNAPRFHEAKHLFVVLENLVCFGGSPRGGIREWECEIRNGIFCAVDEFLKSSDSFWLHLVTICIISVWLVLSCCILCIWASRDTTRLQ